MVFSITRHLKNVQLLRINQKEYSSCILSFGWIPAPECYMATFRNTLSLLHRSCEHEDGTGCSETSAYKLRRRGITEIKNSNSRFYNQFINSRFFLKKKNSFYINVSKIILQFSGLKLCRHFSSPPSVPTVSSSANRFSLLRHLAPPSFNPIFRQLVPSCTADWRPKGVRRPAIIPDLKQWIWLRIKATLNDLVQRVTVSLPGRL